LLDIEALLIVAAAVPEFNAVTVNVLLTPGATVPKFKLLLFKDKVPVCG
jgi:hypothetical protein